MGRHYDREAVDRLARAVLNGPAIRACEEFDADAELEQFTVVATAFHATSGRHRGARRDQALGFGLESAAVAVSTLLLTVAVDALGGIAEDQAPRVLARFTRWFRRRVLRRPDPSAPGATGSTSERQQGLSPEQLRRVHESARRHARRLDLPTGVAEAVANGIVAELAMAPAGPEGPGPAHGGDPEA